MTTSAIQSTGLAPIVDTSASTAAAMGKTDFLKLLVAQLQHQDPLQPMNNTEFVAQLAQFSSLEQQIEANQNLALLQVGQAAMTNSQVASLIGKEVEAKGGAVQLAKKGSTASLNFTLPGAAMEVTIQIKDGKGNLIRTLKVPNMNAGLNSITWDGKDSMGNPMTAGTYSLSYSAKDAAGKSLAVSSKFSGMVTGVTYENGIPVLEIGTAKVKVGDVIAVRQAASTMTTSKK